MSQHQVPPTLRVAFAGTFAASLADPVQARLRVPCEVTLAGESEVASQLSDVDVLVSMGFTREMGGAARRLKLVQVPGAGLDRIDRSALPAGTWLANVYGHEVGIAEYVIGAMLAWTRDFNRLDRSLRRGTWARRRSDSGTRRRARRRRLACRPTRDRAPPPRRSRRGPR